MTHIKSLATTMNIVDDLEMRVGVKTQSFLVETPKEVLEGAFGCTNGTFTITCGDGISNDFSGAHVLSKVIKYGKENVGVVSIGEIDLPKDVIEYQNNYKICNDGDFGYFDHYGPHLLALETSDRLKNCSVVLVCINLGVLDIGMTLGDIETLTSSIRTSFGTTLSGVSLENCNNVNIKIF